MGLLVMPGLLLLTALAGWVSAAVSAWWLIAVVIFGLLLLLGVYDLVQHRHSILRNFPVLGHMRFLLEAIRPEVQQYFIERNYDGRPYDRDTRTTVYERAKGIHEEQAFGTERDVLEVGYEYVVHSTAPKNPSPEPPRVRVGGPDCTQPYDMALLNVSAMSFGALSANALRALNAGAARGGFAHDTGEGGLTKYHLENGGDIVWEIGSGYFGARTKDGGFDEDLFRDKSA
jgi:glutamate synthase domain-containing protein 2